MAFKELRYAARSLRRSPVFAITAVITIALGIGASTAIFSVADAVLLRPLPYKNPDQLVLVWQDMRVRNVHDWKMSNTDYFDLRNGTSAFQSLAALVSGRGAIIAPDGTPEPIRNGGCTPNFFSQMGAHMAMGRDFNEADARPQAQSAPGAPPAAPQPTSAILSYEYWQRHYGGARDILGRTMAGAGSGVIVGVLEPGFELLMPAHANLETRPDVWYPLRLVYDEANRNSAALMVIGRLKDGVNIQQAQAQADGVASELRNRFIIRRTSGMYIRLESMHADLVAAVRPALLALMGAVIFLLLIACSNVANLLLVRASLRERELAVRAAMGGSRWRLLRQMLLEALLLAGTGTFFGIMLARLGIYELRILGPASLPRADAIAIDPVVLTFAVIAGLVAAVIFGVAPALKVSRPDIADVLRSSGRTASLGAGRWLRNGVVIAEVALSFVLLIGSGLMFRSFMALQRIDPGFDPNNVLTFEILGNRGGREPAGRAAFVRDIRDALRAIPGVENVTAGNSLPLDGSVTPIRWGTEAALTDPGKFQATDWDTVLPGYFETMRVPLIAGRTFNDADNAPERGVVVIDQKLAAKAFPNQSAVGKRILSRLNTPEPVWLEVIGVVAHLRESSLAEEGREQIFFTDGYMKHGSVGRWAVRTRGDPAAFTGAVRAAIARKDSHLAIYEVQPMQAFLDKARASTRFSLLLIGLFAVIAAMLTAVGLYGVLSTVVRQRTAEIGVRMAVGAGPGSIFKLIVGHGLRLSAAGIGLGILAALGMTQAIKSLLVDVKATDPSTFVVMALVFFAVAALASWLPARRAACLAPVAALRDE